ncbi:hypothetical protein LY15_003713 [Prauserella flava]|nr:hypothetical protein [Prauserella flava]MCR3734411.1 hypothetical protein [Prauserella salsuginis]
MLRTRWRAIRVLDPDIGARITAAVSVSTGPNLRKGEADAQDLATALSHDCARVRGATPTRVAVVSSPRAPYQ